MAGELLNIGQDLREKLLQIGARAGVLDEPAEDAAAEAVAGRLRASAQQLLHHEVGHRRRQGRDDGLEHVVAVRRGHEALHVAVQLLQQLGHGRPVARLDRGLHCAAALAVEGQLRHRAADLGQRCRPGIAALLEGLCQGGEPQLTRAVVGGAAPGRGRLRRGGGVLRVGPALGRPLAAQAPAGARAEGRLRLLLPEMLFRDRLAELQLLGRRLRVRVQREWSLRCEGARGPGKRLLLCLPVHVAHHHLQREQLHGSHLRRKAVVCALCVPLRRLDSILLLLGQLCLGCQALCLLQLDRQLVLFLELPLLQQLDRRASTGALLDLGNLAQLLAQLQHLLHRRRWRLSSLGGGR
mmetsp:Transcript_15482/g.31452  ORF Transcript_15482/g.31452 Transcript_15482/m.31452 type:complete len:353 (+) Transcript_15482:709-1767(+)